MAVSVDYRLAPETTYAGSIEDNYAGLKWLYDNAEAIGADKTRIALMGESAGGGHAALLAITARDRGEVPVAFVEIKPDEEVSAEALTEWCREHLARFKVPKKFIFGELPKTATGKIQKFELRRLAKEALDKA